MMKMEENAEAEAEALNEWRNGTMFFSGYGTDNTDIRSNQVVSYADNNDHVNNVENSTFDVERLSAVGGCASDEVSCDSKSRGSIAERRARKCGFNADKISTPRFRCGNPLPLPGGESHFLTIPAGISPHMLLDSLILLPNSHQLSPTTGTFCTPSFDRDGQMMFPDDNCDGDFTSMFNDHVDSTSLASFSDVQNQHLEAHVDGPPLSSGQQPANFGFPVEISNEVTTNKCSAMAPPYRNFSDDPNMNPNSSNFQSPGTNERMRAQMQVKNETFTENTSGPHNSFEDVQKESYPVAPSTRTTEDGFNWRKYGQKQVKGSEYPRSYYKCTHPNCLVKKKVERSLDGQITEIIYKNAHNHPKPQLCRKSPSPFNDTSDVWRNTQVDGKIRPDWKIDGFERPSLASGVTEISDPMSIVDKTALGVLESSGTPPEFSSTLANYEDDEEDSATLGNFLPGDDDDKEPDPKRRHTEMMFGSRAVRAPRVVVQIESEVDILDDGYRWRKYGQKVVKGNPNPRSYYKCTSAGCIVRKHVERASHNMKYVITTYEGKHNHEVPAARNSNLANLSGAPLPNRIPHHAKPEPHTQDFPPPFDPRMGYNNDFLRSNYLGPGPEPHRLYVPFSTFPNNPPFNPFGFSVHSAYTSGIMPSIPEFSMRMPGVYPNSETTLSSMQSVYSGQQMDNVEVKPIMPKQEQRDDSFYHAESSSSMYNMENFQS